MASEPTVLYVEDEEGDRFFMQRAFENAGLGAQLRTVPDGEAAIQYLSNAGAYKDLSLYPQPNLLLLDLNLPAMSGFEVLEWIRQQPKYSSLPVIIFSGSNRPEDKVRATALGATEFWQKPGSGLRYSEAVVSLRAKYLLFPPAVPSASIPSKLPVRL